MSIRTSRPCERGGWLRCRLISPLETQPTYSASLGENPEYAPPAYRLSYSSLVTPPTVYVSKPVKRASAWL